MAQDGLNNSLRVSPTPSLAGQKRKRPAGKKYYAVQVGKEPGVYDDWNTCLAQVKGQKGAKFKSFSTFREAQAFAEETLIEPPTNFSGEQRFYGVGVGKRPGIYTDWSSAQAQISGFPNPKYKKFNTRAEAEAFVNEGKPNVTDNVSPMGISGLKKMVKSAPGMVDTTDYVVKDKQGHAFELGRGPLPPGAEDGFDPNIKLDPDGLIVKKTKGEKTQIKIVPKESEPPSMLRIYTDGSSLKNGQAGARAGVGVFFGPQDPKNVSEALRGSRQTNQRAELTAIQRALDIVPKHREVTIYTDSKYSIDCVTNWYRAWIRNGWMNAKGKPVENKDLIQDIREKMDERDLLSTATHFVWVKGHANDAGNIAADRLAVQGALLGRGIDENDSNESLNGKHHNEVGDDTVSKDTIEDSEMEASLQLMNEAMEADDRERKSLEETRLP